MNRRRFPRTSDITMNSRVSNVKMFQNLKSRRFPYTNDLEQFLGLTRGIASQRELLRRMRAEGSPLSQFDVAQQYVLALMSKAPGDAIPRKGLIAVLGVARIAERATFVGSLPG